MFDKERLKINKDDLLSAFEQNFKRSGCYHKITRKENGLELDNDILDFNYSYKMVYPWNLWHGIGEMNIRIISNLSDESYLVKFSISILRSLIFNTLTIILLCIILLTFNTTEIFFYFILFIIFAFASNFSKYLRLQRFFTRTIAIGDFYENQVRKSYDWESILKKKTNSELKEIIKGNKHLPDIVLELAKKEMENRESN